MAGGNGYRRTLQPLQIIGQLLGGLVAQIAVFRQRLENDGLELRGDARVQ